MHAPRRRPTIRRVRDWGPAPMLSPSLRAPRVPLDLVPPSSGSLDTPRTLPIARPYYEEDDEEEEKATLARFIPLNSEVRAILEDPEQTLAYMRTVQASMPDPDSALDSLVAVYEERVARLEKERAEAAAFVAPMKAPEPRPLAKKRELRPVDRALVKLQPHLWKIVFSTISLWGLVQLMLTR